VSSRELDFVTGGGIRIDYLITRKGEARNSIIGGNAIYAAAGAAVWSENIAIWGRVAENYPERWISALEELGFITAGLKMVEGRHDHRTFYAYQPDGGRDDTDPARHYARIGQSLPVALVDYEHSTPGQDDPDVYEPLALRPEDFPAQFRQARAIHLSPSPILSHMELAPFLREQGVRQITVDPGERYMKPDLVDHIRRFLPFVDAFLPSEKEVASLFGVGSDLLTAAETLGSWGARIVVIKRGSRGLFIYDHRHKSHLYLAAYHEPGDRRVVDVTGAGDAFCGGFMVGLAQSQQPINAARMGLVASSLAVEGYGALHALQDKAGRSASRLSQLEKRDPAIPSQ
jgi:ribokinase